MNSSGSKTIMNWDIKPVKQETIVNEPIVFLEQVPGTMVSNIDFFVPYDPEGSVGGEKYSEPILNMLRDAGIGIREIYDNDYNFDVYFDKPIPFERILSLFGIKYDIDKGWYPIEFDDITSWPSEYVRDYSKEVQKYFGHVYVFFAE